jgi:16S rRNA processing protein RimM
MPGPQEAEWTPIGRIVGVFGLQGGLKVAPLTNFATRFEVGARLFLGGKEHRIHKVHWHGQQVRIHIDGVETVEAAEVLRGQMLNVPAADKPKLAKDEFRVVDLIGCEVITADGQSLGALDDVVASPAQDLLKVGEILIPMSKTFVKKIDLDNRTITVELIPGMLNEEDAIVS